MLKQHVLTMEWRWNRCGTCQMNSDSEVSNGLVKAENK